MALNISEVAKWLTFGGRVSVAMPFSTNGGLQFEAGEILHIDSLTPYGEDRQHYQYRLVSVAHSDKVVMVFDLDNFLLVED